VKEELGPIWGTLATIENGAAVDPRSDGNTLFKTLSG
jgi:hypothetical protein